MQTNRSHLLTSPPKGAHCLKLLDALSSHDHKTSLQQIRCKRYVGTAEWLEQRAEINNWLETPTASALWLSGKRKVYSMTLHGLD